MRELTNNDLIYISGASFMKRLFSKAESIEAKQYWQTSNVAGTLFIITTLLSTAATAVVRPNTPLWGLPVNLSLGLGLSATTYVIGESLEWAYSDTPTYIIHFKR